MLHFASEISEINILFAITVYTNDSQSKKGITQNLCTVLTQLLIFTIVLFLDSFLAHFEIQKSNVLNVL